MHKVSSHKFEKEMEEYLVQFLMLDSLVSLIITITIRLRERNDETNWIHINTHSIFCSSRVGMKGGRQDIRAGGCLGEDGSFGKLAHEIMHSLG